MPLHAFLKLFYNEIIKIPAEMYPKFEVVELE